MSLYVTQILQQVVAESLNRGRNFLLMQMAEPDTTIVYKE